MDRTAQLNQAKQERQWDILVIGGGASGLGVALDAVSRGLKVCVIEKFDFGKGTSSRSTKLVHGGVRYLEQGNIRMVKEALKEREFILTKAKHLSKVQSFVVPCYSRFMMIYYFLGLKTYDILAGKKNIGKTELLKKESVQKLLPNIEAKGLVGGVQYKDGQFDDSRLCIDLVRTIIHHGGTCANHTSVTSLSKKEGKVCGAFIEDKISGERFTIEAKYVINATGVFTDDIVKMDSINSPKTVIPSRGSHIVLDKSFLGGNEGIMIPETSDGRVLFIIPWNGKVIAGTTDVKTESRASEPEATEEEVQFILNNCRRYLKNKPTKEDILSTFAGLRPLAAPKNRSKKSKEISRGHKVIVSESNLVSIIGGKWTTFRKMGETVVDTVSKKLKANFPSSNSSSFEILGEKLYSNIGTIHPSLPYSETDFDKVIKEEMPMTLEDVLCRRTRCLFLDASATSQILNTVGEKLRKHLGESDDWLNNQVDHMQSLIKQYAA